MSTLVKIDVAQKCVAELSRGIGSDIAHLHAVNENVVYSALAAHGKEVHIIKSAVLDIGSHGESIALNVYAIDVRTARCVGEVICLGISLQLSALSLNGQREVSRNVRLGKRIVGKVKVSVIFRSYLAENSLYAIVV